MAFLLQGDSPDLNVTPEDVASQRLGGALLVSGAILATGGALAGTAGAERAGTTAVTAACADGDCTNEAVAASQALKQMTHGPVPETMAKSRILETDWTVIGKYPAYLEKAKQLGANALNDPVEKWNALGSRAAQWARNVEFLDDAIAKGHSFRLATEFAVGWKEEGTFFKKELVYLLSKGYELKVIDGAEWLVKLEK